MVASPALPWRMARWSGMDCAAQNLCARSNRLPLRSGISTHTAAMTLVLQNSAYADPEALLLRPESTNTCMM